MRIRQIGTLSETHIFNPSIVNEARLGFNRIFIAFNPANTIDPTSVGLGDGLSGKVGLPQTTLSDIGLVFGGPSGFPQGRADTTGVLSDTVTMLKGKHTIKWGGEFRRYLLASFAGNIGTLTFTTSTTPTSLLPDGSGHRLQHPAEYRLQPRLRRLHGRIRAGQLTKLTPDLTLEYGLRFEWNGTPVEGENRFTIFNPSTVTLTQVGTNGLAANSAYKQNYNLEPRAGICVGSFRYRQDRAARRLCLPGGSAGFGRGHGDGIQPSLQHRGLL